MKLFGKKPSKKQPTADDDDDYEFSNSEPPSPTKSPTKSPKKSSRAASPGLTTSDRSSSKPRSGRGFARTATDPGSSASRRRDKLDPDTHPLNLPPEQRKRLSAQVVSAMSGRSSMDIDREPSKEPPSSPPPQRPASHASFPVPVPNGTNGAVNGDEQAPAPPPHRSQPTSPVPTPEDEAEAFKNAGNRLFKEKDYRRAIEEYSKGIIVLVFRLLSFVFLTSSSRQSGPRLSHLSK